MCLGHFFLFFFKIFITGFRMVLSKRYVLNILPDDYGMIQIK